MGLKSALERQSSTQLLHQPLIYLGPAMSTALACLCPGLCDPSSLDRPDHANVDFFFRDSQVRMRIAEMPPNFQGYRLWPWIVCTRIAFQEKRRVNKRWIRTRIAQDPWRDSPSDPICIRRFGIGHLSRRRSRSDHSPHTVPSRVVIPIVVVVQPRLHIEILSGKPQVQCELLPVPVRILIRPDEPNGSPSHCQITLPKLSDTTRGVLSWSGEIKYSAS